MKKICLFCSGIILWALSANAASVVATVNGNPITDTDVTARTELMARQGKTSTTNRRTAFQNIVDDYVKLKYAGNYGVNPTDKDADKELERMNMGDLSGTMKSMARLAIRADIAWGVVMSRTVVPTIEVSDSDINAERTDLIRERGLPIDVTMIRLSGVSTDITKNLSKPKNCDDAFKIAENAGAYPQKINALQYELANDIRERIANLKPLTWSGIKDGSVLLVCEEKKTKEYQNLDDIIKQNAIYKKASFIADQQLKQIRRKSVIIINDDRYKL